MTAGLYWVERGDWPLAVALYASRRSRLLGAAPPSMTPCCPTSLRNVNSMWYRGYGYALGYLGGGLLFLINVAMTPQSRSCSDLPVPGRRYAFRS